MRFVLILISLLIGEGVFATYTGTVHTLGENPQQRLSLDLGGGNSLSVDYVKVTTSATYVGYATTSGGWRLNSYYYFRSPTNTPGLKPNTVYRVAPSLDSSIEEVQGIDYDKLCRIQGDLAKEMDAFLIHPSNQRLHTSKRLEFDDYMQCTDAELSYWRSNVQKAFVKASAASKEDIKRRTLKKWPQITEPQKPVVLEDSSTWPTAKVSCGAGDEEKQVPSISIKFPSGETVRFIQSEGGPYVALTQVGDGDGDTEYLYSPEAYQKEDIIRVAKFLAASTDESLKDFKNYSWSTLHDKASEYALRTVETDAIRKRLSQAEKQTEHWKRAAQRTSQVLLPEDNDATEIGGANGAKNKGMQAAKNKGAQQPQLNGAHPSPVANPPTTTGLKVALAITGVAAVIFAGLAWIFYKQASQSKKTHTHRRAR